MVWAERGDGAKILIFLGLLAFAGFVYLGHHPESPWLEEAKEWPYVGELARRFQEAYLPPQPSDTEAEPENSIRVVYVDAKTGEPVDLTKSIDLTSTPIQAPTRRLDGQPAKVKPPAGPLHSPPPAATEARTSAPRPMTRTAVRRPPGLRAPELRYIALDWVYFLPGNRILAAAEPGAEVEVLLESMAYLPILSREGNFAQVVYNNRKGWIDTSWEPPFNRKKARRGILRHQAEPIRGSYFFDLKEARKILGMGRSSVKVGAYELYTDVEDETLLKFLDETALATEKAYFARYGRLPEGNPKRSAVLFAKEADYRRYTEETSELSGAHVGHASRGILAFYAEGRPRQELARTLAHEITHLVNTRALTTHLPPWLEEGLATDLGCAWVEDSAAVESDLAASVRVRIETQGMEPRLFLLGEYLKKDALPSVGVLLNLDYEGFHKGNVQPYAYAHSVALIRYFLDGDGGRHADGFRLFLGRIATGLRADLLACLEMTPEELEEGFRAWLKTEVEASRKRLESRFREAWEASRR